MSRSIKLVLAVSLVAVVLIPVAAVASNRFTDVPDSNIFHDDISALADSGVTKGCNPPVNDKYCPNDFVTRGQMAAFMNRLGALAPGTTPVVNAATVDGHDATSLVTRVTSDEGCAGIQAAIDGLPAAGGEVLIGAGTYVCKKPLVIARDNVRLRGVGPATLLRLASGANSPLVVVGDTSNSPAVIHSHIVVSDLQLDGNGSTQPDECWGGPCTGDFFRPIRNNTLTLRRVTDVTVENVIAHHARSGGLVVELGSSRVSVRNFESHSHQLDGLAAYQTRESIFSQLFLHDNGAAGLSFDNDFDANALSNVVIADSDTVGVFMRDSHDNTFANMQIHRSGEHGMFIAHHTDGTTAATGNSFQQLVIADVAEFGIFVANDTNVDNLVIGVQYIIGDPDRCLHQPKEDLVTVIGGICR